MDANGDGRDVGAAKAAIRMADHSSAVRRPPYGALRRSHR